MKDASTVARLVENSDEVRAESWVDLMVVELESNSVVQLVAAKACLSGVMSVEWKDVN